MGTCYSKKQMAATEAYVVALEKELNEYGATLDAAHAAGEKILKDLKEFQKETITHTTKVEEVKAELERAKANLPVFRPVEMKGVTLRTAPMPPPVFPTQ
jgi:ABC-type Fe3+-citrate transport system substrate-binding protein